MKTTNENIRSQRCWQYRLWFGKDWFLHYFRRFSVTVPGSRISMKWTLRSSRTRPTGWRLGGGSSWATLDWRRSSQRYALLSLHGTVGTILRVVERMSGSGRDFVPLPLSGGAFHTPVIDRQDQSEKRCPDWSETGRSWTKIVILSSRGGHSQLVLTEHFRHLLLTDGYRS